MKMKIAAAALALGLAWTPAFADTLVLDSSTNWGATVTWNNDGTVSYAGKVYNAVQQQDKLFSDFAAGSDLVANSSVQFSFAHVNGQDRHTISFLAGFGGAGAGATFNWGYDISVIAGSSLYITSASGDILQTDGSSTLVKSFNGVDGISFTENGTGASGATSYDFNPWVKSVDVSETLTIGANGSDASGVSNSFIQNAPEPSTWAMMGLGFAGLAFAGFQARRGSASAVA